MGKRNREPWWLALRGGEAIKSPGSVGLVVIVGLARELEAKAELSFDRGKREGTVAAHA